MAEKKIILVCPKCGAKEEVAIGTKDLKCKKCNIAMLPEEKAKAFAKVYAAANVRRRRRDAARGLARGLANKTEAGYGYGAK